MVVLLALLLASTGGCWNPFAPEGGGSGGGGGGEQYEERTSIENVLQNLQTSYVYENSEKYLECLAEDFTFWLNPDDVIDDPTLPIYWGKPTETTVTENMFADGSNIDRITLSLTPYGTPVEVPGPNPGDPSMWQYNESVNLMVYLNDPPDLQLLADAGATFIFRQDPDETGPDGETLWEIYEWYDVDKWTQKALVRDGSEENMSVGRLKAGYLD